MKASILFVMLVIISSCKKELSNNSEIIDKEINIERYDSLIRNAEKHIFNENFKGALDSYKLAENSIPKLFATDIYNATLCSVYSEDWEMTSILANKLVLKGVRLNFFDKDIFSDFKQTQFWNEFKKKYEDQRALFLSSINREYIEQLDDLLLEDQQQYCELKIDETSLNEVFNYSKTIDEKLEILIDTYGYPSEELIGANILNDTTFAVLSKYHAILRHSYQSDSKLLDDKLKDAAISGFLKSEVYEDLVKVNHRNYFVIDDKIYRFYSYNHKGILEERKNTKHIRERILYEYTVNSDFEFFFPIDIMEESSKEEFGNAFSEIFEFVCNYNTDLE